MGKPEHGLETCSVKSFLAAGKVDKTSRGRIYTDPIQQIGVSEKCEATFGLNQSPNWALAFSRKIRHLRGEVDNG